MASLPSPTPDTAIDIDAVIRRMNEHKALNGMSWSELAAKTGIPAGTLSQFGTRKYKGDNPRVAATVVRWFTSLAEREIQRQAIRVEHPKFQMTRSARDLMGLLSWAKRGKFGVAAMGPGVGKTSALLHFQAMNAQVWVATMAPSSRGVATMLAEVLKAMGEADPKGSPQQMSGRVRKAVQGTDGLLAIDEAQHLSEQALEELRFIHDGTGVGIVLFGNEQVLARLEGGSRRAAFAQLYSRVGMRVVRNLPLAEDAALLADAWGILEPAQVNFLKTIAAKPGGLRGLSMTVELASILAVGEDVELTVGHLRDAWVQLSSRPLAA